MTLIVCSSPQVKSFVSLAQDEGASVLCGGAQPSYLDSSLHNGYFYEPTVIGNVHSKMHIVQEEVRLDR